MIPTVRSVTAASTAAGSRQNVAAIDVGEDRRRAGQGDRVGGRGEGERRHDHLVARPSRPAASSPRCRPDVPGVDRDARPAELEVLARTPSRTPPPRDPGPACRCACTRSTAATLLVADERLGRGDERVHAAVSLLTWWFCVLRRCWCRSVEGVRTASVAAVSVSWSLVVPGFPAVTCGCVTLWTAAPRAAQLVALVVERQDPVPLGVGVAGLRTRPGVRRRRTPAERRPGRPSPSAGPGPRPPARSRARP